MDSNSTAKTYPRKCRSAFMNFNHISDILKFVTKHQPKETGFFT